MRDIPKAVDEKFYGRIRTTEVPFTVNDSVEIVAGPYFGRGGAVISVESLHPEVTFLVELDDGEDVVLPVTVLRHHRDKG